MTSFLQDIQSAAITAKGWVIRRNEDKQVSTALENLDASFFNPDNSAIKVHYSTLNYKDALALCNKGPVVRSWPLVAGIDLAGEVLDGPMAGQNVLINGYGMGEIYHGGLATYASAPSNWMVPLPAGLNAQQVMALGTAGYTAMLCVHKILDHGITPEDGPVLVTGATGGVGIVATLVLSKLGFEVAAVTGRPQSSAWLEEMGAAHVLERASLSEAGKPLQKEIYSAVVDSVGSYTLANALAQTKSEGIVAACGLAQGGDLPTTVMPFILRGVTLAGVNSVTQDYQSRLRAWNDLALYIETDKLDQLYTLAPLSEALDKAQALMDNSYKGRIVIDTQA